MKTSAFKSFCLPTTRAALPASARAHTPLRYATGAARFASGDSPFPIPEASDDRLHASRTRRPRSDRPQVLHVDPDSVSAGVLADLLSPEAQVTHVQTLSAARAMLENEVFSLVVLEPLLPDGDARALLPLLSGTPLLVYSASQPEWRGTTPTYLPKPWTSARQLWAAIANMLGIPSTISAGD